jgi:hypothetical protein
MKCFFFCWSWWFILIPMEGQVDGTIFLQKNQIFIIKEKFTSRILFIGQRKHVCCYVFCPIICFVQYSNNLVISWG